MFSGMAVAGSPGTYVNLFRVWRSGDEVEFTIPFAFRLYPYRGEDRIEGLRRCAYTYGPFLLAVGIVILVPYAIVKCVMYEDE